MKISKYRNLILFFIDIFIITITAIFLYIFLPADYMQGHKDFTSLVPHLLLLTICIAAALFLFKCYDSLWRYAHSREYLMLLSAGALGYLFFALIDCLILKKGIPVLLSLSTTSLSFLAMLALRFSYRIYRKHFKSKGKADPIPVVIIGAGDSGVKLLEEIELKSGSKYKVSCFIDDSEEKIGRKIHNVEVKGPIDQISKLITPEQASEVIVAIPSLPEYKKNEIRSLCSNITSKVRVLPDTLAALQREEDEEHKIRLDDINIEGLLGRKPAIFNDIEVKRLIKNKVVLVTGGGGSIGSELCRQIAKHKPGQLVILDAYENNAYDIQQELLHLYGDRLNLYVEIASIRDKNRINRLFEKYKPNLVFHTAAHKHVPLMELCPEEAIKNNIFGTYNLVQAAVCHKTDKFVLISTDKAVNPTSVMGASKRFCEMIIQSMRDKSETEFVAVRFGNVLGSNGSVIPLFLKQIMQGGPVTITDKRIVRYFMTISEAVQLVLQAGAMHGKSEIYVLDMGEPVKIIELAENLIRLAGLRPYIDIPIIETGLRPGEKLYEELLTCSKELIATANHKIYIEHKEDISMEEINEKLKLLEEALKADDREVIKKVLKQVVPTYKDPDEVNSKAEIAEK